MGKTIVWIALACLTTTASAQDIKKEFRAFNSMELGVSLGSTGIGLDLATPLCDIIQIRTGFEFMPRFEQRLHFDIQSFDDNGNPLETKFDKMTERLEQFTGYKADSRVDMVGKPTFWNFKLLFDVFPFRNKHWHLTAGFHWGPSDIAEAINALEDAPSLVAMNIYNNLYDKAINHEPIYQDNGMPRELRDKLEKNGRMGIRVGVYKDRYVTEIDNVKDDEGNITLDDNGDPITQEVFVLDANGNKIPLPYRMTPDENCSVSAKVSVNSFKPYIGFGYGGRLFKRSDIYQVSFDAGLMFWGGTPDIITHDGTNLSKDVTNINGKVGRYVDLISGVKVFPVLNVRFARRLF